MQSSTVTLEVRTLQELSPSGHLLAGKVEALSSPHFLPQSHDFCVSWLTLVSPEAVTGKGELVAPSSCPRWREAVPEAFRAARQGKIAQLGMCCGAQSARQPCMATGSHYQAPSTRCRVLCCLSQCHVTVEGQALCWGAAARAHQLLT